MKKNLLNLLAISLIINLSAQTTIFTENFEGNGHAFTLNTGTGGNQWIVNNIYTGYPPFVPNTPAQPGTFTGGTNSKYLHIHNITACSSLGICNASFDTGSASDQYAAMTNNISTVGYSNVSLSFYYLCAGAQNTSYGTVQYSIDGGTTWTNIGSQFYGVSSWTQINIPSVTFDNAAQLKFRFRWQNGSAGADPAFAIDEIVVSGFNQPQNSIGTGNLMPTLLCQGASANSVIGFTANGVYTSGNVFSAELSDGTGSFASPTIIGTLASTSSGNQSINVVIPGSLPVGSNYRCRVVSSNPVTIGDTSNAMQIQDCNGLTENDNFFSVTIYPNPSSEWINIEVKDKAALTQKLSCVIYDILGQECDRFMINNNTSQISLAHLRQGVYYIHLTTGEKNTILRLIKQ